jgi:anaerobic magnesium-protoporphyrin IX monomethyl ester cyclase
MYESARSALKAGIIVGCFFIIGFPEDDYRSVLKGYEAIIKCVWEVLMHTLPNLTRNPLKSFIRQRSLLNLISLFTFQDFGAKKTSYNPKFSDLELSFMVNLGVFLFYVIYFLCKPNRIIQLFLDLGSNSSSNKFTTMAKSFFKEAFTIVNNKLIKT